MKTSYMESYDSYVLLEDSGDEPIRLTTPMSYKDVKFLNDHLFYKDRIYGRAVRFYGDQMWVSMRFTWKEMMRYISGQITVRFTPDFNAHGMPFWDSCHEE